MRRSLVLIPGAVLLACTSAPVSVALYEREGTTAVQTHADRVQCRTAVEDKVDRQQFLSQAAYEKEVSTRVVACMMVKGYTFLGD